MYVNTSYQIMVRLIPLPSEDMEAKPHLPHESRANKYGESETVMNLPSATRHL